MLAGEDSTMVLSSATYRGATLAVCRIPDSEWALVCLTEGAGRQVIKLVVTHASEPTLECGSWARRYGSGPRFHWALSHRWAIEMRSRASAAHTWSTWAPGESEWVTALLVSDDFAAPVPVTEYRRSGSGEWESVDAGPER